MTHTRRRSTTPIAFAIIVELAASGAAAEAGRRYSLEDLETLASGRRETGTTRGDAWRELVEHVEDVPPAQRDERWERLVEAACVGTLAALDASGDRQVALAAAERCAERYPSLRRSKPFLRSRAEVGISGFEACFGGGWAGAECTERLVGFVRWSEGDRELALAAGKLVRRHMAPYAAIPLFRMAVGGLSEPRSCADEDLRMSALSALGLPPGDPRVADAREVAFKACGGALLQAVADAFGRGGEGFHRNTCDVLLEKGVLGGLLRKKCAGK